MDETTGAPRGQGPADTSVAVNSIIMMTTGGRLMRRNYFSQTHMKSAAFQARRSLAIERDFLREGDLSGAEYTGCVIGAIFMGVAAIEAAISEVYITAYEKDAAQRSAAEAAVSVLWEVVRRNPTLERAKIALKQVGKTTDAIPCWKNTDDLLKWRNMLTHYTAGSVVMGSSTPDMPISSLTDMERMLASKKIGQTYYPDNPWFPYTYFSGSCARWAVESSKQFIDDFCRAMDHLSPFALVEQFEHDEGRSSPFIVELPSQEGSER